MVIPDHNEGDRAALTAVGRPARRLSRYPGPVMSQVLDRMFVMSCPSSSSVTKPVFGGPCFTKNTLPSRPASGPTGPA